jgi:aminoglycoside phosphotransferase (APT) family kinase protein
MAEPDHGDGLDHYRRIIERDFPELRGAPMSLLTEGWDSVGVDVDDRLIFKFPRDAEAAQALIREHAILAVVRPCLSLRVPDMTIHPGPPLFSRHDKIPGEHLVTEVYDQLNEAQRTAVAQNLARFYAELHAIDAALFTNVPEARFDDLATPDEIRKGLAPVLPPELRAFAEQEIARWLALPPDPLGQAFSFFDGHGWNMAFDAERGVLNGIYDFADARIAPLQDDLLYSHFISRDLTARIIAAYETMTGRAIDCERVDLLYSMLLINEVAGWEAHPDKLPGMIERLRRWVRR